MKTQHGIAEGWLLGIIAMVVIIGVTNAVTWHISAKYTESGWQKREAQINAEAATKIAAADARVRDAERAMATNLAGVDAHYQGQLKEKDNALNIALNAVRDRGMWTHSACTPVAGNPAGAAAAGASVGDGSARCRLSDADAGFLLSEASRADRIVEQLSACQAVVRADRVRN